MPFKFKEFSVEDSSCAMKVGTDSVLLGAWTNFTSAKTILDIGTGCGILALIAAQESHADIVAIDIDETACKQATDNFLQSKWSDRITCIHQSLEQFTKGTYTFDQIITNPPYFNNSLKSPDKSRTLARHTDVLPLSALISSAYDLLNPGGRLSLIIPADQSSSLYFEISKRDFHLFRRMLVIPRVGKEANRLMIEIIKGVSGKIVEEELAIRNDDGAYTLEYIELTKKFYLFLK